MPPPAKSAPQKLIDLIRESNVYAETVADAFRGACEPTTEYRSDESPASREVRSRLDSGQAPIAATHSLRFLDLPHGAPIPTVERRDLTTTAGAGTIANKVAPTWIQALVPKMVLGPLGVDVVSVGDGGSLAFPRQTAASSFGPVAEGANAGTTSMAVPDQMRLTPKMVGATTYVSRKYVVQVPDAPARIIDDLNRMLAWRIELMALTGNGQGEQPAGVLYRALNSTPAGINGGPLTHALLCSMEASIANRNGVVNGLGFVTSPGGRAAMRQTEVVATSGKFVWRADDTLSIGCPAAATMMVPAGITKGSASNLTAGVLADWTQLTIALFGGAAVLIVNPYYQTATGMIQISMFQQFDVDIQHAESFQCVYDMSTAN